MTLIYVTEGFSDHSKGRNQLIKKLNLLGMGSSCATGSCPSKRWGVGRVVRGVRGRNVGGGVEGMERKKYK